MFVLLVRLVSMVVTTVLEMLTGYHVVYRVQSELDTVQIHHHHTHACIQPAFSNHNRFHSVFLVIEYMLLYYEKILDYVLYFVINTVGKNSVITVGGSSKSLYKSFDKSHSSMETTYGNDFFKTGGTYGAGVGYSVPVNKIMVTYF